MADRVVKSPFQTHLFGAVELIVQGLFGDLYLDDSLPQLLVLVLRSATLLLHTLQLVVEADRDVFGHLRQQRVDRHNQTVATQKRKAKTTGLEFNMKQTLILY